MLEAVKIRSQANLEYLRCEAKVRKLFLLLKIFLAHLFFYWKLKKNEYVITIANIIYLQIASKKNIIDCRKKGINVTKLLHCPICRCDYFGTYATHKLTLEHDVSIKKF